MSSAAAQPNASSDPQVGAAPATKTGKTLVMTATYNEIDNLPLLVDDVFRIVPQVDFLAIDDNSPDGTGKWCDEQAARDPRIRCLHRSGKLGLGTAIVAGMKYAIENGYQYVLNMDADFSHHPRYLPAMISGMEPANGPAIDVMIGSRYVPGGGTEGWPLKRKLMSRSVNLYARWLLWLKSRDVSGGYRCYRVLKLRELPLDEIRSRGYSFQEEVLWLLRRRGAQFGETPIIFADRERGQSKINQSEAFAAMRIILQLGVRNLFGR
ncbi:MAG TPA: polyprenol monophosphomannose synthase [Pirellulales bacterium]|jgi:dolichol-phosphate mannosyltransferase